MKRISPDRERAIFSGVTKYSTGEPCKHGHLAERYTRNGFCVQCASEAGKSWYKHNTASKRLASNKVYLKNRDNIIKRTIEYGKNNKEKRRLYRDKYYAARPERYYEASLKYRAKHPEKVKAWSRTARSKRMKCEGVHTEQDIADRLKWQNGKCAGCRNDLSNKFEVDHIVPLVRGGTNDPRNLQILCRRCNRIKHSKSPSLFYRELGFLI